MIEFEPRKFAEQAWRKGFGDHPGKFGNQEVIARVHEKGVILAIRENVEKENKFTSDPTHFVIQFVMYPKPEHMAEFASNAKKAGIIGPGFSHPANEFPGSMASMRVSNQSVLSNFLRSALHGQMFRIDNPPQGHYRLRGKTPESKERGLPAELERLYGNDWVKHSLNLLFDICEKPQQPISVASYGQLKQMKNIGPFITNLNNIALERGWEVRVDDNYTYIIPPRNRRLVRNVA